MHTIKLAAENIKNFLISSAKVLMKQIHWYIPCRKQTGMSSFSIKASHISSTLLPTGIRCSIKKLTLNLKASDSTKYLLFNVYSDKNVHTHFLAILWQTETFPFLSFLNIINSIVAVNAVVSFNWTNCQNTASFMAV